MILQSQEFYNVLFSATAAAVAAHPDERDRIRRAVDLVERGHVEPSRYTVNEYVVTSSSGETAYTVNGACTCPDYGRAPGGRCKHRLAVALFKRCHAALDHSVERRDREAAEGTNLAALVCSPEWRQGRELRGLAVTPDGRAGM